MPSCSKAKNPKGVEILFEESTHKYSSIIDGKELTYTSGTTFIGKYFMPFDPTGEITKRCALKEGVTPEELKERWRLKGQQSCINGTRVHEICEDIINGKNKDQLRNKPKDEAEQKRFDNAIKIATALKSKVEILGIEKIVFDENLRIAGTIDLLARSKKNGHLLIIDHKTNAKIETTNFYKKFALPPIEHIADNNFCHYALQLNLYQFLLKFAGYVPKNEVVDMYLNHITEDGFKLIMLPDMQKEIKDMVIDYLLKTRH